MDMWRRSAFSVPGRAASQLRDLREVGRPEVSPYGDTVSPFGHTTQILLRCERQQEPVDAADGRCPVPGRCQSAAYGPHPEGLGECQTGGRDSDLVCADQDDWPLAQFGSEHIGAPEW